MSLTKENKRYIQNLFRLDDPNIGSIHSINYLLRNKHVILYGAGDGFITFSVFILKNYELQVEAVIDKKFNATDSFFGFPAYSPDQYVASSSNLENRVVVVTVGKSEYFEEIFAYLYEVGFKDIVFATDIFEYHLHYTPKPLADRGMRLFLDEKAKIMDVYRILVDVKSQSVFMACLETYMKRSPQHVPHEPMETQYFPGDIPLSKGYSRTINCGSYNGDTIRNLNRYIGKIKALACFEPELANYALLDAYLTKDGAKIAEEVQVLPYGVYSRDVELFFTSGNQFNSNLSKTGDISIQCVTIDRLLPDFAPSFINMDIEGAELEALKGAEQVIRRYTPDLAICVYHVMDHLWQIPDFLNRLNVGYKFYMRNYTGFISETVVYATTTKANTELCFGKAKKV